MFVATMTFVALSEIIGYVNNEPMDDVVGDRIQTKSAQGIEQVADQFFAAQKNLPCGVGLGIVDGDVGHSMAIPLSVEPLHGVIVRMLHDRFQHKFESGTFLLAHLGPGDIFGVPLVVEFRLFPKLPAKSTGHSGKKLRTFLYGSGAVVRTLKIVLVNEASAIPGNLLAHRGIRHNPPSSELVG